MPVELHPVDVDHDRKLVIKFLCQSEWPFHGTRSLTVDEVNAMEFASDNVVSFWIASDGAYVGLIRAFDLGDIPNGSPLLDVRVATQHRGYGLGSAGTRLVVDYLFVAHPQLHRVEATTRHDNYAMQRVLRKVGFEQEGRLRDAWLSDGERFDTLIFGLLRSD